MFDEREFLEVAQHLRHADAREGFQRSAISRAYYATFLLARRICRERGLIGQGGGGSDHRTVTNVLSELDRTLAMEFRNLRSLRNDADYSDANEDSAVFADNAQLAIDLAEFIRSELQRLR